MVRFNGFVVTFQPILALHNDFLKFSKLLGGRGTICLPPPQYFHWATAPPPPRIDASVFELLLCKLVPNKITARDRPLAVECSG